MFGTELLDVAIGLIFLYLLLSLIASAVLELVETVLKTRAKYLWQGIGELVGDRPLPGARGELGSFLARWWKVLRRCKDASPDGPLGRLYKHALISGLYFGDYDTARRRVFLRTLPAYIPRSNFAIALIDLVSGKQTGVSTIEAFRRGLAAQPDGTVKDALQAMAKVAGDDLAALQRHIEGWYDMAMDRVSGWYKRHTQALLLVIGLALAWGVNADSIAIARYLATDEAAREQVVAAAGEFVNDPGARGDAKVSVDRARQYLTQLNAAFPGPLTPRPAGAPARTFPEWLGLVLTALAVSLGGPFWFDLLNKMMVIRSTVKPREKSREEGSDDRQPTAFLTSGGPAASRPTT
jgi:hypothetical protein